MQNSNLTQKAYFGWYLRFSDMSTLFEPKIILENH